MIVYHHRTKGKRRYTRVECQSATIAEVRDSATFTAFLMPQYSLGQICGVVFVDR